jgi:hypothetical protein
MSLRTPEPATGGAAGGGFARYRAHTEQVAEKRGLILACWYELRFGMKGLKNRN